MKRATSYSRTNGLQRRDAKQIIDEFAPLIRWRADGRDSLLDIGCGCGDVTIDYIRPLLPQNYSRLIGADLSEQMLGVARKRYDHMNISFNKIDIGGDLKEFLPNDWKPVDHVTSFYCLHWVHDQQRAVKNIYDLLTPNGDCLLAFLASTRSVDVYMEMAKMPKWAPYMADVELTIAPFQNSEDAAEEFTTILKNGKFKDCHVVVWDLDYIFVGVDDLKESMAPVNPFIDRLPVEQQNEFMDDFVRLLVATDPERYDTLNGHYSKPYKMLIAYARK